MLLRRGVGGEWLTHTPISSCCAHALRRGKQTVNRVVAVGAAPGGGGGYDWALLTAGPPMLPTLRGKCRAGDPVSAAFGGPGGGAWVVTRRPRDAAGAAAALAAGAALGLDTSELLDVPQEGCAYAGYPPAAAAAARGGGNGATAGSGAGNGGGDGIDFSRLPGFVGEGRVSPDGFPPPTLPLPRPQSLAPRAPARTSSPGAGAPAAASPTLAPRPPGAAAPPAGASAETAAAAAGAAAAATGAAPGVDANITRSIYFDLSAGGIDLGRFVIGL